MLRFLFGGARPRNPDAISVCGEVETVSHGQMIEDKSSGPDFQVLTIACERSGKKILCACFSDQADYSTAKAGERVKVLCVPGLDENDFGTPFKAQSIQVLGLA